MFHKITRLSFIVLSICLIKRMNVGGFMKLLALDSSILEAGSVSRQLMTHYLNHWQRTYPEGELIYRDLDKQGLSHLSSESLNAAKQPESIRSKR